MYYDVIMGQLHLATLNTRKSVGEHGMSMKVLCKATENKVQSQEMFIVC